MSSSNLVFPCGIDHKILTGGEAREKAIEIMSSNSLQLKSFVLCFEPDDSSLTVPNNVL